MKFWGRWWWFGGEEGEEVGGGGVEEAGEVVAIVGCGGHRMAEPWGANRWIMMGFSSPMCS